MSRFGGRFVPNIENEVRRQARETVSSWRQEWVLPTSKSGAVDSAGVRILKWVKVQDNAVTFPEEDDVRIEDRVQDDSAILEAPVQSIHNAPVEHVPTNKLSMSGGLGGIAPRELPPAPAPTPQIQTQNASADTAAAAVPESLSEQPISVATASAILINDMEGSADTSLAASVGEGASGTQTPSIQPQVDVQLNNTTSSATEVPEGPTDSATLAVLATAGDASDTVAETIEPGQPPVTINDSEENTDTIAPAEQELVDTQANERLTDVEMKDE